MIGSGMMKRLLLALIVLMVLLTPIYSASTSGFAITYGETTYNNPSYKSTVLNYFKTQTSKNLDDATSKVITASEVNQISKNITGRTYNSNQIFSCALVDLSYSQGIKIVVDTSKVTTVTSKMYANALKSSGIENGYVVVTSPVTATGESALTGVLKSYEIAVGTSIPEEAKQAATEELYTETEIANQTGQDPDKIANLFDEVKQEVSSQNLQDPAQIKVIVINIANNMNINLSDEQAQQIADALANSQKAQSSLSDFKNQLQIATQQASQSQGILEQIWNYVQSFIDYLSSLAGN
jgi:uncharacterized protein YpuA (DUF1002 family)